MITKTVFVLRSTYLLRLNYYQSIGCQIEHESNLLQKTPACHSMSNTRDEIPTSWSFGTCIQERNDGMHGLPPLFLFSIFPLDFLHVICEPSRRLKWFPGKHLHMRLGIQQGGRQGMDLQDPLSEHSCTTRSFFAFPLVRPCSGEWELKASFTFLCTGLWNPKKWRTWTQWLCANRANT